MLSRLRLPVRSALSLNLHVGRMQRISCSVCNLSWFTQDLAYSLAACHEVLQSLYLDNDLANRITG